MPIQQLKEFLDDNKIKYVVISHSRAYTAQEIAAASHISGYQIAKTVVIKVSGKLALAVLPATYQIDFDQLKESIGTDKVELASERDFTDRFPGCEIGAMPPFGNLYGMETYVAETLTELDAIAFNACSHTELIKLTTQDYGKLVKPKVLRFSSIHRA